MDSFTDYAGPPRCGHCNYALMPTEDAHFFSKQYPHLNIDPHEPAPHGWVHDPAEVNWKTYYCNGPECGNEKLTHHSAYPSDGASPEVHKHAESKFLDAVDTKFAFEKIMKDNKMPNNPNINPKQFGEGH